MDLILAIVYVLAWVMLGLVTIAEIIKVRLSKKDELGDAWVSALKNLKLPKDHYRKAFMKKHTRKSPW